MRQKDETHKQAIIAASIGKIKETFAIHENNFLETKDLALDSTAIYMQGDKQKRARCLFRQPGLRDTINNQIRLELQEEGGLKGAEKPFTILRQKDLSKADCRFAQSYQIGDILKLKIILRRMSPYELKN